MAPKTIWSSLSRRSSEVPASDDRTIRVMLWERKARRKTESRPGKRGHEESSSLFWIPAASYILSQHSPLLTRRLSGIREGHWLVRDPTAKY